MCCPIGTVLDYTQCKFDCPEKQFIENYVCVETCSGKKKPVAGLCCEDKQKNNNRVCVKDCPVDKENNGGLCCVPGKVNINNKCEC